MNYALQPRHGEERSHLCGGHSNLINLVMLMHISISLAQLTTDLFAEGVAVAGTCSCALLGLVN